MTTVKSFPEEIKGDRIYLKKHDLTLAPEMFHTIDKNRERLGQFMPWPATTLTVKDSKNWILLCLESWKQRAMFDFGIYLSANHRFIGNAGVHSIDWRSSRCELGYWIAAEFESNGFISEAVQLLESVCFELDFHRIEIRCSGQNLRSANVAARNGYRLEGYLRDEKFDQGQFLDQFVFAKIKMQNSHAGIVLLGFDLVYIFVEDLQPSKQWYQKVFNEVPEVDEVDVVQFRLGGSKFCLHLADAKSPLLSSGSIGYWRVAHLHSTIEILVKQGAKIHREPFILATGEQICQIQDPFGNVIGLIGSASKKV